MKIPTIGWSPIVLLPACFVRAYSLIFFHFLLLFSYFFCFIKLFVVEKFFCFFCFFYQLRDLVLRMLKLFELSFTLHSIETSQRQSIRISVMSFLPSFCHYLYISDIS